jgi:DNA-binding response OmpR family regulator
MKKVVVIEDDEDMAKIIKIRLQKTSYAATILSDGWKAIAYLTEHREQPDAVILGLMLPGHTGFELSKAFRSSFPRTKIFVFSAYRIPVKAISELGVAGVFCKTDGLNNLLNAVEEAIEDKE